VNTKLTDGNCHDGNFIDFSDRICWLCLFGAGKNQPLAASPPDKQAKSESPPVPVKSAIAQVAANPVKVPAKKPVADATPQPKTATASAPKSAPVPKTADKRGLKDPKTSEIATNYSNYRITKRWTKKPW